MANGDFSSVANTNIIAGYSVNETVTEITKGVISYTDKEKNNWKNSNSIIVY